MNKTIYLINQYVTRYTESGGTRHLDFSEEWVKRGYDVHIIASGFHYNQHEDKVLEKYELYSSENINGVNVHWVKVLPYKTNGFMRFLSMFSFLITGLYICLFNIKKKPNIVIGSSPHLLNGFLALLVSRIYKASLIFEVRDLWPESLVRLGAISERHPVIKFFKFIEITLYKKSDFIVTLLDGAPAYISQYTSKEIKVIPNGTKFNLSKLNQTERNSNSFTVGYMGTVGYADAVDVFLKAAILVHKVDPTIKFNIYGGGKQLDEMLAIVKNNNINNVCFYPPIPKSMVFPVLSESSLLWVGIPNSKDLYKYGISPNKLYDYMSASRPVIISTDLEDTLVERANAGYVIPADSYEDLAEVVLKLSKVSVGELDLIGSRGAAFVNTFCTIDSLVEKWFIIFDRLTSARTFDN